MAALIMQVLNAWVVPKPPWAGNPSGLTALTAALPARARTSHSPAPGKVQQATHSPLCHLNTPLPAPWRGQAAAVKVQFKP